MKKIFFNSFFVFLGSFFATTIMSIGFIFFYFYNQVSIMSNLIAVSQYENYKVYVYSAQPIPASNLDAICIAKQPSDIKAVIYIRKPNLFGTNSYNIGVIGKVDDICDNDKLNNWGDIEWKNNGVEFGRGMYFLSRQSFSSLK